jgi:hypothetical protein
VNSNLTLAKALEPLPHLPLQDLELWDKLPETFHNKEVLAPLESVEELPQIAK